MADDKKYFWLKLKDDFFAQKEIKKLRRIAGGDTYTIIYLKLQLLSIKSDGKLIFEGVEDNFIDEMALTLDEEIENVKITLMFLQKHGLIEELRNDEYFLPKVCESIGSESSSAERVRRHRMGQKMLQCNTSVTNSNVIETKRNTEIEIEIEKDIDIKKDIEKKLKKEKDKYIDDFFAEIWKLYPRKNGKSAVTKKAKVELYKLGLEKVTKAINKFKAQMQKENREIEFYMYGSTFFNGGYIDYLDSNSEEVKPKPKKQEIKIIERDYLHGEVTPFY
jgi:predicted phage replisome organizer